MFCRILHCFFAKTGLSWFTRFWQISWMAIDSTLCWWGSVRLRHAMQVVQIISRLAELQSVIKLPLTVCSLLQKPIYRWHITYLGHDYHNIVVGWGKRPGHGHRVLRASIGVFSVELLHIFSFFFNFTFFQRRTFTYFHQLLHFWYHHHCFHWPIQIYSFQRWQKWSDENALFANLIIETNY